jgi:nitric oxide dioxygenase
MVTLRVERLQHLFIVRIWQEPSASAPPGQWRGSVEHVSTGQRLYFANIEDLNKYILGQMNKAAMGATIRSSVEEHPPASAAPDEKSKPTSVWLSDGQVALLQTSFRQAAENAEALTHTFYRRLFEVEPSLRKLFPADLTNQEQKFITMLAVLVDEMGSEEKLQTLLGDLGKRHIGYGTRDEHYSTVGSILLWTLSTHLGDDFTPEVEAAWIAAYRVIAETMKSATG